MTTEEMRREIARIGDGEPLGRRIERTYWKRYALPSMAFVLGAVGAAIALSGHARSRARSAILGMVSLVLYYASTRVADYVAVQYAGTPFWMAWGPNVLMLVIAVLAIWRAGRPR